MRPEQQLVLDAVHVAFALFGRRRAAEVEQRRVFKSAAGQRSVVQLDLRFSNIILLVLLKRFFTFTDEICISLNAKLIV